MNIVKKLFAVIVVVCMAASMIDMRAMQEQKTINERLMWAVEGHDVALINRLISQGAEVNSRPNGNSVLYQAGTVEAVKALLGAGAHVNGRNERGNTALMKFFEGDIVRVLIEGKADVHMRNNLGCTALMFPKDAVAVEALLAARADVNAQNADGMTPLMGCPQDGDVVKLLLAAGADMNAVNVGGRTALMYAVHFRRNTVCDFVWAGVALEIRNNYKHTAWDLADEEMKKALLEAESDALASIVVMRACVQQVGQEWEDVPRVIRELVSGYVADVCDEQRKNYWAQQLDRILTSREVMQTQKEAQWRCAIS